MIGYNELTTLPWKIHLACTVLSTSLIVHVTSNSSPSLRSWSVLDKAMSGGDLGTGKQFRCVLLCSLCTASKKEVGREWNQQLLTSQWNTRPPGGIWNHCNTFKWHFNTIVHLLVKIWKRLLVLRSMHKQAHILLILQKLTPSQETHPIVMFISLQTCRSEIHWWKQNVSSVWNNYLIQGHPAFSL